MIKNMKVAVVIPCYRVTDHISEVLRRIPSCVDVVYCVDDACPDGSGDYVINCNSDSRVRVIRNSINLGVGGAVKAGYALALADGVDIVVKIDGDGQMAPECVPGICAPITIGVADYVKGNRFHNLEDAAAMPLVRLIGNAALSFITKLSSGYYGVVDPTNGFTAIHRSALEELPLGKIANRYFFESDMLFRLGIARAAVVDYPMRAIYANEKSGLRIGRVLFDFSIRHTKNYFKRLGYRYFLRDFNIGSVHLMMSLSMLSFGSIFGVFHWVKSASSLNVASAGTVMLSALPIIIGFQGMVAFLQYDVGLAQNFPLSKMRAES